MDANRPLRVGDLVEIIGVDPHACSFTRRCVGMQGTVSRMEQQGVMVYYVDVGVKCEACQLAPYYERQYLKLIGNRPDLSSMDKLRELGLFNDEWIEEHANA